MTKQIESEIPVIAQNITENNIRIGKTLCEKAILISVQISQFSGTRKDKRVTNDVSKDENCDINNVRVWKSLLKSKKNRAVSSASQKLRLRLYELSAPWNNNGERICSTKNYIKVKQELEQLIGSFYIAVADSIQEYADTIASDYANERQMLGGLFNKADYPTYDEFRHSFKAEIVVSPVPSNDYRSGYLSKEDLADINSQIEARIESSIKETQIDIMERARESLNHLVNRLIDSDGKFHNSALENVIEEINQSRELNILDNAKIDEIFNSVAKKISTIDAASVRDSEKVRNSALITAKDALKDINSLMADFMA